LDMSVCGQAIDKASCRSQIFICNKYQLCNMHHDMRIDICCYIYNSMLYKKLIIHCFQNTGFPAQLLSLNRTSILFLPPDGTLKIK
ncbi:TPA: hypothetical protein ACGR6I_001883, partial [Escherichia coli]